MAKCPICEKDAHAKHRPFCSDRCRDIDLNRWLSNRYSVAASEEEQDPEAILEGLRKAEMH
ncbi:DNA gyrase inhibitor YacG [Polycladidibacter hongkongensis]|uniref:DNA gyrase inhibitor YacG n=1 Tax=Polycladidibacter hongkongensis TaxID=1647556 RepID=UPI00082A157E|nr:DNA gyrase inhibitor YacG [Pseudovibrio hongkongensis]